MPLVYRRRNIPCKTLRIPPCKQQPGLGFWQLSRSGDYLWFKSRYIPRALAAWGIFSSLLVAIVTLAITVFPGLAAVVIPVYFVPIFIFEVGLGLWLLAKGIRSPIVE